MLAEILDDLVTNWTWEAVWLWFIFPKMVLRASGRGGNSHKRENEINISKRLALWKERKFGDLWDDLKASIKPHSSKRKTTSDSAEEDPEKNSARSCDIIRGLVEEGAFSKAAKHLISKGVADASNDPEVSRKLQALHPHANDVSFETLGLEKQIPSSQIEFDAPRWGEIVRDAIFSFPPGSAPGPSGLRPAHIKQCVEREGASGNLGDGFGRLVGHAFHGTLPQEFAPLLCSSNLIPLNKKDGGIRPIAVGDTTRRIIGKTLLRSEGVRNELGSLQPRQVGVGVRNATEMVGMGLQRVVDALDPKEDWVTLQIDVSNAFNSVNREAILQGAEKKATGLFNWLAFCYGQKSPLFCQGSFLCWSHQGVHHGDPCGPAACALGLDEALDQCMGHFPPLNFLLCGSLGIWTMG